MKQMLLLFIIMLSWFNSAITLAGGVVINPPTQPIALKMKDGHIVGTIQLGNNPYNPDITSSLTLEDITVVAREFWYVRDEQGFRKPWGLRSNGSYNYLDLFAPRVGKLEQGKELGTAAIQSDGSFDIILKNEVPMIQVTQRPKVPWIKRVLLEEGDQIKEVTAYRLIEIRYNGGHTGALLLPDVKPTIQFFGDEEVKHLGTINLNWIFIEG